MQINDFFEKFGKMFGGHNEINTKAGFLKALSQKLSVLPKEEREKSLNFYEEIIDDKIEEVLTVQEAVESLGSIDEIVADILENSSVDGQTTAEKKGIPLWARICLLVVSSPLWCMAYIVMLIAFVCILILGIIEASFALMVVSGIAQAVLDFICKYNAHAVFCLGIAIMSAGLGMVLFKPIDLAMVKSSKFLWEMTVKFSRWLFGMEG